MSRSLILMLVIVLLTCVACGAAGQGNTAGSPAAGASAGNSANGQKLFAQSSIGKTNAPGCSSCHSTQPDQVLVGPSLGHIATDAAQIVKGSDYKGKATDAAGYVRESIVEPNAYVAKGFSPGIMYQNYGKDLADQEVNDLVAYLMTLQ